MLTDVSQDSRLLSPEEGPAVEVINPAGRGAIVLVCEHASNRIPHRLGDLGLSAEARLSHIAWDPGALPVAMRLSKEFDAPLVAARFSRLVFDCNRPAERADAMPERSEIFDVPGNRALTAPDRAQRVREIAEPFCETLAGVIDDRVAAGRPTALVTIHSFTPVYFGQARSVELGILHDADSRLADAMLVHAASETGLRTERNEPYGPASGVTHTLKAHALTRGLPNVMIEIRNDLIADAAAQGRVAAGLARALRPALRELGLDAGTAAGAAKQGEA
ncbi:N-formylglutamate amidohydrolase [Limibaculum sp. M0105]|uniref:N-formylglutamate amidohydrolase n=1 Tax=Thermohalobaculum xanthum TaxID=2753746 RepID=A0A8J7M748_9RHOB|nr:N-formylglutamate amidohydrolase [Thermohalobaculum xanthum]MBK0399430.1 N-formylglutamate amidohydrolase [Thermohalobaculum xanthum]